LLKIFAGNFDIFDIFTDTNFQSQFKMLLLIVLMKNSPHQKNLNFAFLSEIFQKLMMVNHTAGKIFLNAILTDLIHSIFKIGCISVPKAILDMAKLS